MLTIKDLTKFYKKQVGVQNINLDIANGEIFGFIGPNGAGKSTTIKCVLNFLKPESGSILFDDKVINDELKNDIGYLPAEINLYEDLTVKGMLEYNNSFYKFDCMPRAKELVDLLELDVTKKIDELSLGNLKKIGIVLALMHSPKLVILDEPTSGLDPLMQEKFFDLMLSEKAKGTTIFFSSHNLNEVKRICDRVAIIRKGQIIDISNVKDLTKNQFVIITIKMANIDKLSLPEDIKIKESDENHIVFIYKNNINEIISLLNGQDVSELLIEEPTIEEIFMHYYKED